MPRKSRGIFIISLMNLRRILGNFQLLKLEKSWQTFWTFFVPIVVIDF